jgi:dTDP-4-amino-4,6-dideoxygalactose transaminase
MNISPKKAQAKFELAAERNELPKVIIPVHFAGQACSMRALKEAADKYGCKIIEDACQAMGGTYFEKKIGSCEYSDLAVFSLHPVKSITTGEGGLILTNNETLYRKIKLMCTHGIARGEETGSMQFGPWHAEMITEGYNYKITDIQCALGISQLQKLDNYVKKRKELAQQYMQELKDVAIRFQMPLKGADSAWHIMIMLVDFQEKRKSKMDFYDELKQKGIHLALHYYPIHLHRVYRELGFKEGMFPEAEKYYEMAFTLPLHPGLESQDVHYICSQIRNSLS